MEGADLVRNHDSENLREGLRDAVHLTARVGTSLGSRISLRKTGSCLGVARQCRVVIVMDGEGLYLVVTTFRELGRGVVCQ
jgi:hypothetical protein